VIRNATVFLLLKKLRTCVTTSKTSIVIMH